MLLLARDSGWCFRVAGGVTDPQAESPKAAPSRDPAASQGPPLGSHSPLKSPDQRAEKKSKMRVNPCSVSHPAPPQFLCHSDLLPWKTLAFRILASHSFCLFSLLSSFFLSSPPSPFVCIVNTLPSSPTLVYWWCILFLCPYVISCLSAFLADEPTSFVIPSIAITRFNRLLLPTKRAHRPTCTSSRTLRKRKLTRCRYHDSASEAGLQPQPRKRIS